MCTSGVSFSSQGLGNAQIVSIMLGQFSYNSVPLHNADCQEVGNIVCTRGCNSGNIHYVEAPLHIACI